MAGGATSAIAINAHSHTRNGPTHTNAATGTGTGSQGSTIRAESHNTVACCCDGLTTAAIRPAAVSAANNHHGDGRTPMRVALPAGPVKARAPADVHAATAAMKNAHSVQKDRRPAIIWRAW